MNEAVEELADGKRLVPRPVRIDARVDAYVPPDYVSSEALKIDLHRRLALAATDEELRELHAAVEDRYGPPPEPVENLFALQEARLRLAEIGADYAVFRNGKLTVGPVLLGAEDVRDIRSTVASAAYVSDGAISMRSDGFREGCRCSLLSSKCARQHEALFPSMNTHRALLSASLAAAVMALSLGASACGGGDSASGASLSSGVVASVAGDDITQAELDEVIAQAKERLESQGQKIPAAGSQEYQAFQQNALAYLVQRRLSSSRRRRSSTSLSPTRRSTKRVARVLTQFFGGSRKKYEEALEKQGITDAQVRDELRATLVSEKIFEKVGASANVTDAEIKAYYNAHPELYMQQGSRRVRHILVKSKALADDIHGQLAGRR